MSYVFYRISKMIEQPKKPYGSSKPTTRFGRPVPGDVGSFLTELAKDHLSSAWGMAGMEKKPPATRGWLHCDHSSIKTG